MIQMTRVQIICSIGFSEYPDNFSHAQRCKIERQSKYKRMNRTDTIRTRAWQMQDMIYRMADPLLKVHPKRQKQKKSAKYIKLFFQPLVPGFGQ